MVTAVNSSIKQMEKISRRTCDEFTNFHVVGFPQQANESGNPIAVLDGHFVVMVFAEGDIPQGSAGLAMDLRFRVVQQAHQHGDPLELPDVLLYLVVLVAEVLQVGGCVGLDRIDRMTQHSDDLGQVGVPPAGVFADAVDRGGTAAAHEIEAGHAASFGLGERCRVHAVDVGVPFID